jgi:iron complex outermembrane receptor protein
MSNSRSVRRKRRLSGARLAAISLATCAAGIVSAQETAGSAKPGGDADSQTLETVIVTAQFRSENLQQTPVAITAITGDMLDARSQTSLQDVSQQAPNVILQQNPAGGGNSMRAQIRGVGQTDFDPAVDPGVGIYVDDVYFATLTGSDFALLDLDRIEILRGPQGTLSGMNSLGGSVKLYSQKPTGADDGYVEATYGSLNRIDVKGSADFSLIKDTLFLRLSGVARRTDGYVQLYDYACTHPTDPYVVSGAIPRENSTTSCKDGTEGAIDYNAVRASLRWLPASNLEANLIMDATNDNSGSTANTLLGVTPVNTLPWMGAPYDSRYIPANPYSNYANFLDPGKTYTAINTAGAPGVPNGPFYANPNNTLNAWGLSANVDWKIADGLSLKSITAYRRYTSDFGDDNSDSPVPLVMEEAHFTNRQFSQELRLNGVVGTLLDYTVGGIYFDQRTVYASREDDPFVPFGTPSEPTFDFMQNDPTRTKTHAAFVNTSWHLTDLLTLNAGTRYTKEDKSYTFERLNIDGVTPYLPLSNPANPLNGKEGVFDGSHVDYRIDLDYQWTPQLMTYASWSTGFKGGGISPRPYYPQQAVGFGPETLQSTEVGLKSQWFENRLRANTALFYEDYKGYQASANNPALCVDAQGNPLPAQYANPCGEYFNAADAVAKGIEQEFEYKPADGLLVDASFSYMDFEFIRSRTTAVPDGSSAPGVGKVKASAGVQYEFTMGDNGSMTPRLDASYTPNSCGQLPCAAATDNQAYTLVNARATYWSPKHVWSLAFQITNLTDKLYYLSKVSTGAGYIDGQIAAPREYAVVLRRQF